MKRRKIKFPAVPSPPEEAGAFNAKEAISSGHEAPVGQYVRDLAEVLNVLASLLDPTNEQNRGLRLQFVAQGHPTALKKRKLARAEADEDWDSSLLQVREAIENGNAVAVGWYFRDAAGLLNRLAGVLTGQQGSGGRRLKFHRKRPGKPFDPSKRWEDAAIVRELAEATLRYGKQEAAIAEVAQKRNISRAKIMRAKKKSR